MSGVTMEASDFVVGDEELLEQGFQEGLAEVADHPEGQPNGKPASTAPAEAPTEAPLDPARMREEVTLRRAQGAAARERVRADRLERALEETRRETREELAGIRALLERRAAGEEEELPPVEALQRHIDSKVDPILKEAEERREAERKAQVEADGYRAMAEEIAEDRADLIQELALKQNWHPTRADAFHKEAFDFARQHRMAFHVQEAEKSGERLTDQDAYLRVAHEIRAIYGAWKEGRGASPSVAVLDYALANGFTEGAVLGKQEEPKAPVQRKIERQAKDERVNRALGTPGGGATRGATGRSLDLGRLTQQIQAGDSKSYDEVRGQYGSFGEMMRALKKA